MQITSAAESRVPTQEPRATPPPQQTKQSSTEQKADNRLQESAITPDSHHLSIPEGYGNPDNYPRTFDQLNNDHGYLLHLGPINRERLGLKTPPYVLEQEKKIEQFLQQALNAPTQENPEAKK